MDFISSGDWDASQLEAVLALAARLKTDPHESRTALEGRTVGLFFEKPSTRTRVSCEVGSVQLGAHPVVLKGDEVGLKSREAVEDVGRVLDRYLDALAFRVFDHQDLVTLADNADAPVINLLSDVEHPCQSIADLQTLAEHRHLPGASIAYVGDGNNVAHSLLLAGTAVGVSIHIAHPPGHAPDTEIVEAARARAQHDAKVLVTTDTRAAVEGVDAVYTDVWASMGQESEAAARRQAFAEYQVDRNLFGLAADDAIFMHCLPAHRGEEVTAEVMEHERSRVFDQAENRLHAFKAILLTCME